MRLNPFADATSVHEIVMLLKTAILSGEFDSPEDEKFLIECAVRQLNNILDEKLSAKLRYFDEERTNG